MKHNDLFIFKLSLVYVCFNILFRFMAGGGLSQFYVLPGAGPTVVLGFFYSSWGFTALNVMLIMSFIVRFCILRYKGKPTIATALVIILLLVCEALNEWARLSVVALFA